MSIANELGELFRRELQTQLVPLQEAVRRMEEGLEALEMLRSVTFRLAPLTSRLGAMAGVRAPLAKQAGASSPPAAKRGRGGRGATRQEELPLLGAARVSAKAPVVRARGAEGSRTCAVIGCKRPSRSKGYCSAHYQKLRLLMRTGRRPSEWVDDAKPQSVQDVKLPRGRAASKVLQEARQAAAPSARGAKAKGRKKARSGQLSLH
ncbi:vegetative protein [Myxococcus stipitatus]|uniref:vegetative protein n=1 Tax=Myxococcus stipitatus TaxID=83455 RepID=UPI001F480D9A|nr:vegetative protein [Myxococcus stipitatus]MCE9668276.1 vegetative protein [Myxococcus stipitatus]